MGICAFFIIKLMLFSGYQPCMNECVKCGETDNLKYFSSEDGGVLCSKCAHGANGVIPIKSEIASIIDGLAMLPNSACRAAQQTMAGMEKDVFRILSKYVRDRTGKKLPALYERYL